MQEPNTENTQPTRPNPGAEETMPVQINRPVEQTAPTRVQPAAPAASAKDPTLPVTPSAFPPAPKKVKKAGRRRWPFVLLGILCLFLFTGAGGWLGYRAAIQLRKARMEEQRVTTATEHFMLGMQAQANKQYEIARQQFEYVIRLDPSFPGAADKLREVMIAMAVVNTPTPAPTEALPTLTPTLDSRPQEEIYNQAVAQYAAKDWEGLFGTIDSLRRIDPKYKAVEVDDMLYVALRYRGVDKILHLANLEGGLYDLALAEQFGPLDVDALGYRALGAPVPERLHLLGDRLAEGGGSLRADLSLLPQHARFFRADCHRALPHRRAQLWRPVDGKERLLRRLRLLSEVARCGRRRRS